MLVVTGSRTLEGLKELRLILIGKTGAGKSAAGNTILGTDTFEAEFSPSSKTTECQRAEGEVRGRRVVVVDTPGLFDTCVSQDEVRRRIQACLTMSAPGPHAFLVVLRLGRFTKEERETVKLIQAMFGESAAKRTLVLFTHGDRLKGLSIEEFISKSDELQEVVRRCHGRFHVFNNEAQDPLQAIRLLWKIDKMMAANKGRHYTKKMATRVEKAANKEKRRLEKESEAQEKQRIQKIMADIEREMKGEVKKPKKSCLIL